jgi:membrane protease YdiL (CAAX protease family)
MEPKPIPPLIEPRVSRFRYWIHLILIASFFPILGIVGLRRKRLHTPALTHTASGLLVACAVELLVFGIVFGLACYASRITRDDLMLHWRGKLKPALLGVGYSLALRIAIALLVLMVAIALVVTRITTLRSLQHFFATHHSNLGTLVDVSAMSNNPVYFWLVVIFTSFVVAGLREELWRSAFLAGMKALWPQRFGSRAGQVGAVFIIAIFFGLGHLPLGVLASCIAGLLGVGLGLIMVFHRSIWPAVIAHGLFDATSFAMIPLVVQHLK